MSIVVTIEGVDRSSSIVFNTLKKVDHLNQQVDVCEFKVRKYGSLTYVPSLGDEVIVTRDGTRIFGGVVVRIAESVKASKILEYTVQCNDYSQYLKRELVTERYESTTVGAIISDLVTNYTTDGFTTSRVVGGLEIESFSFNRLNVADCLQKLADAISYVWYVDYDKDIHFFPKNAEMGETLTDTSANYIFDSLEIMEDLTQIRNSVLVQGGEAISDTPRTEVFSGDGTKDQFALANKYDSTPTVEVGGVAQTVGVEFLDDDASFDCMWNFNEKYIRFTAGNTPASDTNNIEVSGTYLFPIVVRVPAPSSIAQFGIYEYTITDKSIKSQDEAIQRAIAELTSYQNELYEGSFRTYADSFRSGQVVTINSTQREKNIKVLIQSVTARMRDPEGNQLEYDVRFATLKSIGIIEYLQNQLRSKEVIVDDAETLLNYIAPDADEVTTSDSLAAPTTSSPPYKWASDWLYKQKITIPASSVSGSGVISDYVALIDLADLPTHFHENVKAGGADVRVYASDNETQLPREIIYDETTDTGQLWFKGDVDGANDTDFYIWYGNADATEPASDSTYGSENVWGANAKYIGHFEGDANDSSANGLNGVLTGTSDVAGQIGRGRLFNGTSDLIELPYATAPIGATTIFTVKALVSTPLTDTNVNIFYRGNNASLYPRARIQSDGAVELQARIDGESSNAISTGSGKVTANTFARIVWEIEATALDGYYFRIYVNGVLEREQNYAVNGGVLETGTSNVLIGRDTNLNFWFRGILDEFQMYAELHSADYHATESANLLSPSTFYTIGEQTDAIENHGVWGYSTWS